MFSNNPLAPQPQICFSCISSLLSYENLSHADLFCRTFNLPFNPDLWISIAKDETSKSPSAAPQSTFKTYTETVLSDAANQPNLSYTSTTSDLWLRTNREWEKTRSFSEILLKLDSIRDDYVSRSKLKWGEQYEFNELLKLDSIYSRTLKSNNITNPLQKEAVKTLCKLQIELDHAIAAQDTKAIRDFATAWSTFSKQADLDTMIAETRTDEITTVSELYDYMERQGFQFKYFDGVDRDEVDKALTDLKKSQRDLILEATGLQPLLEEMARKRSQTAEEDRAAQAISQTSLADLSADLAEPDPIITESDEEATAIDFAADEENVPPPPLKIERAGGE